VTSRPRFSSRPARGGCTQGGFSLLEVVVAFAILALSLGLLIQIFSRALQTTTLSGDYSRAATLAQAHIEAVGIDIPLEPGSYGGDAQDGFSWQVSIAPYELRLRLGAAPGRLPGYLGGILERQERQAAPDRPDQPAARGPIRRHRPWYRQGPFPETKVL